MAICRGRLWGIFCVYSMGTVASEHFKPMPHTAEEVVMEIFRFDGDGLVGESKANALAARAPKSMKTFPEIQKTLIQNIDSLKVLDSTDCKHAGFT